MKSTLQDSFDAFIVSRKLSDLSAKTILDYEQCISPFLLAVGPQRAIEDLRQSDINGYISQLLERPLSKATRATYIRHVKIFLRWAEQEYKTNYQARLVRVPKSPKKIVRIYSDDEVERIFESIRSDSEWLTLRNKAVIALMYDSGLRQSEVCTLLKKNLFFSDSRLAVHGKGDKERIVPMGYLTCCYLKAYLSECPFESDFVFLTRRGDPLTCNAVKLMVSKLSDRLTLEISSHRLRHNFATNYCLDQYDRTGQVDIYRLMYLLGHEDVETTKRYLHFAYEIISSKGCISHLDNILFREN